MAHTFRSPPQNSYYAVIFFAQLVDTDLSQYRLVGDTLLELAREQSGFLGYDDACAKNNFSFNVSYWKSLEAIRAWKNDVEHCVAQAKGKNEWYQWYEVKIAKVERAYSFSRADAAGNP